MSDATFAFQTSTIAPGFCRAPAASAQAEADFAVAGIAWDGAVSHRPGARLGPQAIRIASHMLCDATHPWFDVAPAGRLVDYGDLTLPNTSIERMRTALAPLAADLIERHHMIWLGGDHSITLPLLRAYRAYFGRPLALIHFDAHCDTWADHFGEPSGHGTWVREAIEEQLVDARRTVQIGIRSSGLRSAREYVRDHGGLIYTGRDLRGLHSPTALANVIAEVRERLRSNMDGSNELAPVYLSLDIDCLDPAYAPGTGTPEPGGMTSDQVLTLLEEWADLDWVGMDLCEVAPPFDHAELTSNAAATFVWTYLCGRIARERA